MRCKGILNFYIYILFTFAIIVPNGTVWSLLCASSSITKWVIPHGTVTSILPEPSHGPVVHRFETSAPDVVYISSFLSNSGDQSAEREIEDAKFLSSIELCEIPLHVVAAQGSSHILGCIRDGLVLINKESASRKGNGVLLVGSELSCPKVVSFLADSANEFDIRGVALVDPPSMTGLLSRAGRFAVIMRYCWPLFRSIDARRIQTRSASSKNSGKRAKAIVNLNTDSSTAKCWNYLQSKGRDGQLVQRLAEFTISGSRDWKALANDAIEQSVDLLSDMQLTEQEIVQFERLFIKPSRGLREFSRWKRRAHVYDDDPASTALAATRERSRHALTEFLRPKFGWETDVDPEDYCRVVASPYPSKLSESTYNWPPIAVLSRDIDTMGVGSCSEDTWGERAASELAQLLRAAMFTQANGGDDSLVKWAKLLNAV